MDINVIVINGRLTKDAEKRVMTSGTAIVNFSIANGYRKKSGEEWKDETNFFEVVYMGKGAEAVFQYLTKGRQVSIDGELRQNRWEQDGQNKSKVVILARSVQLLAEPKQEASQGAKPEVKQEANQDIPNYGKGPEGFVDNEEDIPF